MQSSEPYFAVQGDEQVNLADKAFSSLLEIYLQQVSLLPFQLLYLKIMGTRRIYLQHGAISM
jgi:hypothetical protein